VSVTTPLMSPAFVDCPKAVPNDPARRTPTSKVNRPDFIGASKTCCRYLVLIPIYRATRDHQQRQAVVYF
jgi:hypothetical protein